MSFIITGTGRAVPERTVTNDELSTMMETSDEWISTRTGIREQMCIRDRLRAALLACACFATIGSAEDAKITAKLSEDYTNVSLLENAGTFDKLFDGDDRKEEALSCGSDNANVVAFKNADATKADANSTLFFIIDLVEERTLSSMTISFYNDYNVMIGLGAENTLTVSSSDNGTDFTKVEDFTFESEAIEDAADGTPDKTKFPVAGVYDETFKFTNNVTARYLELKIPYEETQDVYKRQTSPCPGGSWSSTASCVRWGFRW